VHHANGLPLGAGLHQQSVPIIKATPTYAPGIGQE
jgi:hypothetical protein